jgi:hypothetical protein
MSERLGSSGGNNNPSVANDVALRRAYDVFHGGQQDVASSQLYVGQEGGVRTNIKSDGTVDFTVGATDDKGKAKGVQNTASIVMADTTKDTRAEVHDQAVEAAARDPKRSKLRTLASRFGIFAPAAAVIATAEKIPGLAGGIFYFQRVIGRVIHDVSERSMEKKLINERDMDTSARYKDTVSRLSQEIAVDGDNIALLNEGETRNAARNDHETALEQAVRDQIGAYWDSTSAIPPSMKSMSRDRAFQHQHGLSRMSKKERKAWYDKYQADFRAERSDPEYQELKRAELEQNLTAAIEAYNTTIHKKDGTRGMFSANNFMQFADAGRNALEMGASIANVRNGFDKVNMVFAEAASPVPEERVGRIERFAAALHNKTRGLISVDTIGIAATTLVGIFAGTAKAGTTMAARTVPIVGSAITAGAFSAVSEAKRTKQERSRASRKVAYGGGESVDAGMREALMETKSSAEVMHGFNEQLLVLAGAIKDKDTHITADQRNTILNQLASFDQRLQAQVENKTPLFSYSSREKSESEFWDMRRRRSILQNVLAEYDARQKTTVDSPDFADTLAASRDHVRSELADYQEQYLGSEASRIDMERTRADQVYGKMRNARVAKAALSSGLMVGAANALGPVFNRVFGPGTLAARAATALGLGAIFAPRIIKDAKQMAATDRQKRSADRARLQEVNRLLEQYSMAEGTAQVDGARPHNDEPVTVEASTSETVDNHEAVERSAEEITDADAHLMIQELDRLEKVRQEQDRRERAITRAKEILQGSGRSIPSDEDLATIFNRTVSILSASRSQAA